MHTLATAAAAVGLNKSTVLRAIRAGKISAAKDEHGEWQIDAAELHRVYAPVAANGAGTDAPHRYAAGEAAADALVAELRAQLAFMSVALDDAKAQRAAWQAQAERLALRPPAGADTATEPPGGWWRWLRSRG